MRHFVATLLRWTRPVYVSLVAVWVLVAGWQVMEHRRVRESARTALINRSQDISTTLGLVIRSQRRFGGVVSQERLESALTELVKAGEMISVALLNAAGEVVASAGPPVEFDPKGLLQANERWDGRSVTLVNLVDLGPNVLDRGETNRPTIVLPRRDPNAEPRDPERRENERRENERREDWDRPPPQFRSNDLAAAIPPGAFPSNRVERERDRERGPWPRPGRPPFRWDEKEYKELLERRGLHGLAIALSTDAFRRACTQDLWMRSLIGCFASVSVLGLGLAWRNLLKSSELQMRLLRASELTTHLKEMNVAAAGLAHETRNPLNIIRGLAQMIGKQQDASSEIRRKTREITDETDRVTAQLNEFINYSRPREVRRAAISLSTVIADVARALTHDLEEKSIRLQIQEGLPAIDADEQLLRQALFNLLINAVQAAERGGNIEVASWKNHGNGVVLEIRDDGPGVPLEHRAEIFKPYFTTQQQGTGLGLAVVQQIVLAHGWEIECLGNEPTGARFRISHLKPAGSR